MYRGLVPVAVLGAVLALAGCATTGGHGSASSSSSASRTMTPESATATPTTATSVTASPTPTVTPQPPYVPPKTGVGYSTAPVDQRQPIPALESEHECGWLPQLVARLKKLGAIGSSPSASGCDVSFPGHENLEVASYGPYTSINQDTTYLRPTTVVGLQARYYSFVSRRTDTTCAMDINTRSLGSINVDAFNDHPTKGSFAAHCARVGQVAPIVAAMFVPLAGGHPWSRTPQQPSAATLAGRRACDMVGVGPVIYADDLTDSHPKSGTTARGTSCTYTSSDAATVAVLLTRSHGGLAALPADRHATVLTSREGVLPARTEQGDSSCAIAVQLINGQVLQLKFTLGTTLITDNESITATCLAARSVMSAALTDLVRAQ